MRTILLWLVLNLLLIVGTLAIIGATHVTIDEDHLGLVVRKADNKVDRIILMATTPVQVLPWEETRVELLPWSQLTEGHEAKLVGDNAIGCQLGDGQTLLMDTTVKYRWKSEAYALDAVFKQVGKGTNDVFALTAFLAPGNSMSDCRFVENANTADVRTIYSEAMHDLRETFGAQFDILSIAVLDVR